MQIYILRHAIAEEGRPGQSDSSRRLTPEGKQKLERILGCAWRAGVRPDVVVSSPYKRAMETAMAAREALQVTSSIIQSTALTPMEPAEGVWEEIRAHQDAEQVMVVGHEPQLSSVVGHLAGGRVEMKKGAMARVDVETLGPRPQGTLVWLLTAKVAGAA